MRGAPQRAVGTLACTPDTLLVEPGDSSSEGQLQPFPFSIQEDKAHFYVLLSFYEL